MAKKLTTSVFSYLDFREYLRDVFQENKEKNRFFTHRYFAKLAGLGSYSYLRMVIKGERNLTTNSVNKIVRALKLNKKESAYFENLAYFNQSTTDKDKDLYFDRLVKLKPRDQIKEVDPDKYEYFTKRYFVTIREMVALPNFTEDYEWIAKSLYCNVTTADVEHAVSVLIRLGLLGRDEKNVLCHTNTTLKTMPMIESIELYNYNRSLLNEAKEALISLPDDLIDISSMTIPIPKNSLADIRNLIAGFREELADYICKGSNEYDEVYQMNLQFFPLTNTKTNTKDVP